MRVALCALSLAVAARAAPPPPAARPGPLTDADLLAAARPHLRGAVIASDRSNLPNGNAAILVAAQLGKDAPVTFTLMVFEPTVGTMGAAAAVVLGHDEVKSEPIFGAPVVALAVGAHPVAPGALTATVGWKAPDGSSSEQRVIYRESGGRLARLFDVRPNRSFATAGGRAGERNDVEVLQTSTGGFKDLRVRSRECTPQGECGDPSDVWSYTFDGVRYAQRPYSIPFVEKIVASSELASSGAIVDYSAGSAIDGRRDTAWCEGAPGPGWFQKLELTLAPAQRVQAISILPGPPKGEVFGEWTRPKRIRVLLPDGQKVEAALADEPRPQRIALPGSDRIFGLTLVIVDVYKGKREDACINELDLEVEP